MTVQSRPYGVIIVALDDPAQTERALAPARELARAFGSNLVLMRSAHNVTPAPDPTVTAGGVTLASQQTAGQLGGMSAAPYPVTNSGVIQPTVPLDLGAPTGEAPQHIRQAEDTAATGELNILSNQLRDEGFTVEEGAAAEDLAEAVLAEARLRGASMIVLATQRASGFERLFGGDTADKILRDAPCPVLIIP